jgi:hypothetical protein
VGGDVVMLGAKLGGITSTTAVWGTITAADGVSLTDVIETGGGNASSPNDGTIGGGGGTTGDTDLSEDDEDGDGFATFGFSWLTETASVTAFSSITNSRDVLLVVAVERNRPYRKKTEDW